MAARGIVHLSWDAYGTFMAFVFCIAAATYVHTHKMIMRTQVHRYTGRQTNRQTHRHTDTDTHTDIVNGSAFV